MVRKVKNIFEAIEMQERVKSEPQSKKKHIDYNNFVKNRFGDRAIDLRTPENISFESDSDLLKKRVNNYVKGALLTLGSITLDEKERKKYDSALNSLKLLDSAEVDDKQFAQSLEKTALVVAKMLNKKTGKAWKDLKAAESLATWEEEKKPIVTFSHRNGVTYCQIDEPLPPLNEAQLKQIEKITKDESLSNKPIWFQKMPEWERTYLKKKIMEINKEYALKKQKDETPAQYLNRRLQSIPSLLRTVPGLANYNDHTFIVFDENGEKILESTRARSSILSPVKIKGPSKQEITTQNLEQLLETQLTKLADKFVDQYGKELGDTTEISIPVLTQTLLSPSLVEVDSVRSSESKMLAEKDKAIAEIKNLNKPYTVTINGTVYTIKPHFISTNHPINAMRQGARGVFLDTKFVKKNDAAILELKKQSIEFANLCLGDKDIKRFLEGNISNKSQLKILIINRNRPEINKNTDLKRMLTAWSSYFEILENKTPPSLDLNTNLLLSSYEQIIVEAMGGLGYGSCKSGKDRKGLEVVHTDALLAYYAVHGDFPPYEDDRKDFVEILDNLLRSEHQQRLVDYYNAPGVSGIKKLKKILPQDVVKELTKTGYAGRLAQIKKFAKLNKPKKPFPILPKFNKFTALKIATVFYPFFVWLPKTIAMNLRKKTMLRTLFEETSDKSEKMQQNENIVSRFIRAVSDFKGGKKGGSTYLRLQEEKGLEPRAREGEERGAAETEPTVPSVKEKKDYIEKYTWGLEAGDRKVEKGEKKTFINGLIKSQELIKHLSVNLDNPNEFKEAAINEKLHELEEREEKYTYKMITDETKDQKITYDMSANEYILSSGDEDILKVFCEIAQNCQHKKVNIDQLLPEIQIKALEVFKGKIEVENCDALKNKLNKLYPEWKFDHISAEEFHRPNVT